MSAATRRRLTRRLQFGTTRLPRSRTRRLTRQRNALVIPLSQLLLPTTTVGGPPSATEGKSGRTAVRQQVHSHSHVERDGFVRQRGEGQPDDYGPGHDASRAGGGAAQPELSVRSRRDFSCNANFQRPLQRGGERHPHRNQDARTRHPSRLRQQVHSCPHLDGDGRLRQRRSPGDPDDHRLGHHGPDSRGPARCCGRVPQRARRRES
jgi:hypothetical protein